MGAPSMMDWVAIVVATVAGFMFGGVYYTVLSKFWLDAVGQTEEQVRQRGMTVPLIITAVALLVMAIVLSGLIHHIAPGSGRVRAGLITGFLCWLGFVATTLATNHAYQSQKPSLTVIDGGYWLGVLLLQGLTIGLLS